jgi:hypothetical protein
MKEKIMSKKVTKAHAVEINKIMLPLIATVGQFSSDENDLNMFKMYAGDVEHNIAALCVFNSKLDAEVLHNSIMQQDTAPREHFYSVLEYIEENGLIPSNKFACM